MGIENMYMGGVGIKARTRELTAALWDAVPYGAGGAWLMICGPFTAWFFFLHRFEWEPPVTTLDWIAAVALAGVTIIGGWLLLGRWRQAHHALQAHTDAIKVETAKRGKGWARS